MAEESDFVGLRRVTPLRRVTLYGWGEWHCMVEESDTVWLPKLDQSLYSEIRTEKFVALLSKFCRYIYLLHHQLHWFILVNTTITNRK
jgi:hypothetical protein